jgi:hypothetical protein
MFCDQKCMVEAQKRFHDIECEIPEENVRKLQYEMPGGWIDPLLRLRTIIEAWRMAGSVEKLRELMANPNTNGNIFDVDLSHEKDEAMDVKHLKIMNILQGFWTKEEIMKIANNRTAEFMVTESILRKRFPIDEDFKFMLNFSLRLMSIRTCNPVLLSAQKAVGILPFGNFFNHSCDPNVCRLNIDGNKIASIVMKPVKKGEQLFITYDSSVNVHMPMPAFMRQASILQRYRFRCTCFACVNNWSLQTIASLPRLDKNFFRPNDFPKNFKDAVKEFKKNCKYIKKNFKNFPSSSDIHLVIIQNFKFLVEIDEMDPAISSST